MNIEDFNDFPIRARAAYAIMCCERYVAAVYPKLDFRRVASVMWQITDGSDYIDSALYRLVDIYPSYICSYEYDNYESFCKEGGGYTRITEDEFVFFKQLLDPCKEDAVLESIMRTIFEIPMHFEGCTIEPLTKYPDLLNDLREINDILEQHQIELPDYSTLAPYAVSNMSKDEFKRFDWWGKFIQPQGLSIYLK